MEFDKNKQFHNTKALQSYFLHEREILMDEYEGQVLVSLGVNDTQIDSIQYLNFAKK